MVTLPVFLCCRGNLTFVSPPIQTSILALERQMSSRWFCFWKRSGPPDCNLNKYAVLVGSASGARGSAALKQRRDSADMRAVLHERGMRGVTQRQAGDVGNAAAGTVLIQTARPQREGLETTQPSRRDNRKQSIC